MKTQILKLLVGATLFVTATLVQAQFNYTNNGDGTCTIMGYTGPGGAVTIPDSIAGLTVTGIGSNAFYNNNSLTTVIIPASVTSIRDYAFSDCTSLTAITVDAANSFYSGVDGVLFDKNQTALIAFPGRRGGSYAIPASVNSIGNGAFYDCTSLTGVIISDSVTSIGNDAFYGCSGLTTVTIPGSVTSIGSRAFLGCQSLTRVVIPDAVTSIGGGVFWACTSLSSVTIPNSVTSIPDHAFGHCTNLTSITIPASVTSIGNLAFLYCFNLRAVYFLGNAPLAAGYVFVGAPAIVYYFPGATGWGSTFTGVPTELWNPQASALGVTGGNFGFNITGPSNTVIVVEACTNLPQPAWLPVSTNALDGSGASSFSDPQSGIYPARFYRFRSP